MDHWTIPGLCTLRRSAAPPGDGGFASWDGEVALPGGEPVQLSVGDDATTADETGRARLAAEIGRWFADEPAFRRAVAADLLDLVNHGRAARRPVEAPLSVDALAARLRLDHVDWDDGAAEANYDVDEAGFGDTGRVRAWRDAQGRLGTRPVLVCWLPAAADWLASLEPRLAEARTALAPSGPRPTGRTVDVPGLGTLVERIDHRMAGASGEPASSLELVSWEAGIALPGGEPGRATVWANAPGLAPERVRALGERLAAFLAVEPDARRRVATRMLALANDWWDSREDADDDGPLTVDGFLALMRLESASIEDADDAWLTVYYDDDGRVFAGHAIEARFDAALELVGTDIPG